jgi:hypothetical protein
MLDTLRTPFLIVAIVLMLLAVCVEVGAGLLLTPHEPSDAELLATISQSPPPDGADLSISDLREARRKEPPRPGLAIRYMALLDGLVLFTVGLMGLGLVPSFSGLLGKIQGIATLILSILVLLGGIVLLFVAFGLLMLMVGLFLSVPFGTLAYLAIFGFFDRGGAAATLSLLMLLKLGFAVCLVLAHQRFLTMKRIVLLVLTSLLANVIVSFLHGLVPVFLVSITDAVAALVVGILALVWALVMLVGSILSIVKVLQLRKASSEGAR